MANSKKILFPVDLSESPERILSTVKEFVGAFQAELHLLLVARLFSQFSTHYVEHNMIASIESAVITGGEKKMAEFKTKYFSDFPNLKTEVNTGYPAEGVLKYVTDHGIDLIIMGTHGRKGLERVFFGSGCKSAYDEEIGMTKEPA